MDELKQEHYLKLGAAVLITIVAMLAGNDVYVNLAIGIVVGLLIPNTATQNAIKKTISG